MQASLEVWSVRVVVCAYENVQCAIQMTINP